ncbi:hypothetical protein ACFOG5_21880 [Pedobacter fastidiosus]|uniref:hypothetical protein n=1 Tax=Pedobacter fastidiosus TaxID=2765361 RepID=UPI00360E3636
MMIAKRPKTKAKGLMDLFINAPYLKNSLKCLVHLPEVVHDYMRNLNSFLFFLYLASPLFHISF